MEKFLIINYIIESCKCIAKFGIWNVWIYYITFDSYDIIIIGLNFMVK